MSGISPTPAPDPQAVPPGLRFLKILVTVLAGTMIAGLITIVSLIVIRFPAAVSAPALPAALDLPADAGRAVAVTAGPGWYAVVTDGDELLLFQAEGRLIQRVALRLP